MSRCEDLYEKAKNNPAGLRLDEAGKLAECWGFIHRTGGKHPHIYKRPGFLFFLNFQPGRDGKAKKEQVKQLLNAIEMLQSENQ